MSQKILSFPDDFNTRKSILIDKNNKNAIFTNEGISAASFCRQVAALVPNMFCYFYVMKNHKIANNSTTTEAREKIRTYLKSLEF
jgi:hypothetical protein